MTNWTLFILVLILFQVRIARIFNTYGPRMCIDDGRVVSNFVAQVFFCGILYYIITNGGGPSGCII